MFPIPWNFPFRKKDGDITTIGEMVDGGGGGSELPPHTVDDAGKVLGVDNEGLLEWGTPPTPSGTKIYYKEYDGFSWNDPKMLAEWSNDTAVASNYRIFTLSGYNTVNINIAGYTPISAKMRDKYTGYNMGVSISLTSNTDTDWSIEYVIARRANLDNGSYSIRVYYVKNEDIEQIT